MRINRHLRRAGTAAVLWASLSVAAVAGNADFSGTWKLNTDKGENLGMVKAVTETVTIRQTPAEIVMEFTSKFMLQTTKRQVRYDLAGAPVPNEGAMGDKATTTAAWADGKLVVTWAAEGAIPGTQNIKTETRSLSADGKTMTVTNERKGKPAMVMVYDRQ